MYHKHPDGLLLLYVEVDKVANKKTVVEISTMAATMVMSLNENKFSDEESLWWSLYCIS